MSYKILQIVGNVGQHSKNSGEKMKIIDIIKAEKPSLSFEVFPPKTSDNFESVKKATEEIALLKPSYMSFDFTLC